MRNPAMMLIDATLARGSGCNSIGLDGADSSPCSVPRRRGRKKI
jgi:hypothetical protein